MTERLLGERTMQSFRFLSLLLMLEIACSADLSKSLEKLKAQRQLLVKEMKFLGDGLDRARIRKNSLNTELLLDQLDRNTWPKIVDVSNIIFDLLTTDDELERETKYQEELRKDVAALRFRSKARRCKSPDETFYHLWKRCVAYQGRWVANPCPDNQQLFDSPENVGVCDCKKNVNRTFIYSNNTRQCHALNSQGPCRRGQWWIIKTHIPECQPVPKGCPADGHHVYWSPEPRRRAKKCWRLKTRGPCPEDRLLNYDEINNTISCQATISILPHIAHAPNRYRPPLRQSKKVWCPRGSLRDRTYKC